jgi:hypothetical protein
MVLNYPSSDIPSRAAQPKEPSMTNRIREVALLVPMMLAAGSVAAQPKPAAPPPAPAAAPAAKPAAPAAAPAPAPAAPAAAKATAAPTAPAAPAAPAAAAAATPPPPPKPAVELDTFKFFTGKWKCDGKAFASPMSPTEHAVKGSAEGKLVVDNFWQSFTYEEKKTKEHPGLKVNGYWGYDQGAKRFVRGAVGNHGEWDTASAPGWEGDKLVWTGELSGPMGRVPFHHTFTKKSDKEWTHLLELRLPDGKWVPAEDIACKK